MPARAFIQVDSREMGGLCFHFLATAELACLLVPISELGRYVLNRKDIDPCKR